MCLRSLNVNMRVCVTPHAGEIHQDTATSVCNVAEIHRLKGNHERALKYVLIDDRGCHPNCKAFPRTPHYELRSFVGDTQ